MPPVLSAKSFSFVLCHSVFGGMKGAPNFATSQHHQNGLIFHKGLTDALAGFRSDLAVESAHGEVPHWAGWKWHARNAFSEEGEKTCNGEFGAKERRDSGMTGGCCTRMLW